MADRLDERYLTAWPSLRRSEKELADRIGELLGAQALAEALEVGSRYGGSEAIALARGDAQAVTG